MKVWTRIFLTLALPVVMLAALAASTPTAKDKVSKAKGPSPEMQKRIDSTNKIMKAIADKGRKEGITTVEATKGAPCPQLVGAGVGCVPCALCAFEAFGVCMAAAGPEDPACEAAIAALLAAEPWCYVYCVGCFV